MLLPVFQIFVAAGIPEMLPFVTVSPVAVPNAELFVYVVGIPNASFGPACGRHRSTGRYLFVRSR